MTTHTDILILCGGFGTRLQSVVSNTPKPLAQISGTPFLEIVLNYFSKQGYKRFILGTGYLNESFNYLQKKFTNLTIEFSIETIPLGTGGAVVNALPMIQSNQLIVLNGDSFLSVQLPELELFHQNKQADISFCLSYQENTSRYSRVSLDKKNQILKFEDKDPQGKPGFINSGVVCINQELLKKAPSAPFIFEDDFITPKLNNIKAFGFEVPGRFIDIGIPESYKLAQSYLKDLT